MQLSMLIGRPVLSPAGENFGYVTGARLSRDFKRISCLLCADGDEEDYFLPMRAVLFQGDAVVAGRSRLQSPTGVPSPIGKAAYTHTGERRGTVCDLLLGDGSEAVLVISEQGIRTTVPLSLAMVGEHIVVYPDAETKARAGRCCSHGTSAKPKAKRPPTPRKIAEKPAPAVEKPQTDAVEPPPPVVTETPPAAQPPIEEKLQPVAENTPPPEEKPAPSGAVMLLNRTNLLGRRVKRSVFDEHGIPVALAGERITPAILSRARRSNRLLQLTVNTLTTLF